MIMKVDELRAYIETEKSDTELQMMLDAAESFIRSYTNNTFQNRNIRFVCASDGVMLNGSSPYISAGDTIQITDSGVNDGLYMVKEYHATWLKVDPETYELPRNVVTKIEYPPDVILGVVNLLRWDIEHRDKVGVASESISRHSVTYFDMNGDNSSGGYPKSITGFLKPYMKARFGQGCKR